MANYLHEDSGSFAVTPGVPTVGSASGRVGGRADKRRAIMGAARNVFGREGYARTSIDKISAEAGVSTRTIYNHFEGKERLFSEVLHASATQVADGFVADVGRRVRGVDPKDDLVALGRALAALRGDFPEHFAMVGQIEGEAAHFPAETIDAWRQAGPLRVLGEISRRLRQLADGGLLRVDDASRAAVHFAALVTADLTTYYGSPAPVDERGVDAVVAGVEAFLDGYATPPRAP